MPTSGSGVVSTALAAIRRRGSQAAMAARPAERTVDDTQVLVAAVEAVARIHHPSRLTVGGFVCAKCLDPFPCSTMRVLEDHLRAVNT